MKTANQWLWSAFGKHPSASDFFSVGASFPLALDFSGWVKTGYSPLAERRVGSSCSWRFWARGRSRGEIACGLLRDSHDCFGRPFPLLILGTGPLPAWEENWEKLPAVLERVWRRIELDAARLFGSLAAFEEELGRTRPPDPDWPAPHVATGAEDGEALAPLLERLGEAAKKVSSGDTGSISLGGDGADDGHIFIMHATSVLKKSLTATPNSVFIGGTNSHSFLVFFRRPMRPPDFGSLWDIHNANKILSHLVGEG
ncbi:MAG TPA: TagF domain-containing protein [Geobacteraceae bacterium]